MKRNIIIRIMSVHLCEHFHSIPNMPSGWVGFQKCSMPAPSPKPGQDYEHFWSQEHQDTNLSIRPGDLIPVSAECM